MDTTDKPPTSTLTPGAAAVPSVYDRPDWASRAEDVVCPLCQYNLRGLIDPRCPECGYQFTWPDLLDPARQRHPYLFELHPESNFKSFWKTAFHGLRPRKFWTTLRADQQSDPGRLFLYWLIVAVVTLIGVSSECLLTLSANYLSYRIQCARVRSIYGGTFTAPPFQFDWVQGEIGAAGFVAAIVFTWPWLSFAALMIFRMSMRRAKINVSHVVRCIIYSSDIFLWTGIAAILFNGVLLAKFAFDQAGTAYFARRSLYFYSYEPSLLTYSFWLVAGIIFVFRLMVAYWRYLRFRHVIATIILTQIIVLMFVAVVVLNIVVAMSGH